MPKLRKGLLWVLTKFSLRNIVVLNNTTIESVQKENNSMVL